LGEIGGPTASLFDNFLYDLTFGICDGWIQVVAGDDRVDGVDVFWIESSEDRMLDGG
jgi:hypothetical protein